MVLPRRFSASQAVAITWPIISLHGSSSFTMAATCPAMRQPCSTSPSRAGVSRHPGRPRVLPEALLPLLATSALPACSPAPSRVAGPPSRYHRTPVPGSDNSLLVGRMHSAFSCTQSACPSARLPPRGKGRDQPSRRISPVQRDLTASAI